MKMERRSKMESRTIPTTSMPTPRSRRQTLYTTSRVSLLFSRFSSWTRRSPSFYSPEWGDERKCRVQPHCFFSTMKTVRFDFEKCPSTTPPANIVMQLKKSNMQQEQASQSSEWTFHPSFVMQKLKQTRKTLPNSAKYRGFWGGMHFNTAYQWNFPFLRLRMQALQATF